MLKGVETPSQDETNTPTSPHRRALAPLTLTSFLNELSPPFFSTLQMMLRYWKGYTQMTRHIFIISLCILNDTCNKSTMIWTKLGFSQGFSPSLNIFFHWTKHSVGPISSSYSSCALHLSQYSTIPSSVLPRSFFSNAKSWVLAMMLCWKDNGF